MTLFHKQRKLRNIIINPQYQFRYIAWVSLTGVFLLILNSSVFYYYIKQNYKILVDLSPMEDEVKIQLYRELHQIVLYLGLFSFTFILICSAFATLLSHRTAGALFHFKRIFLEIQKGNLNARIHIRPKDDFQDVAKEFNKMVDTLVNQKK